MEIPTPDVSGQISTHNSDTSAHSDIRTSISNLNTLVGETPVSDQISTAISAIDHPVESVNGKTGAVVLTASDFGIGGPTGKFCCFRMAYGTPGGDDNCSGWQRKRGKNDILH